MITKIIMPQMSLTMQTGIISKWYKSVGDSVIEGEPLCELEGDKAVLDLESPASGILLKIIAKPGEEFPVKESIGYIGEKGDTIPDEGELTKAAVGNKDTSVKKTSAPENTSSKRVNASPIAKRLASEKGIDISKVIGTGEGGRIGKNDIQKYIESLQENSGQTPSIKSFTEIEKIIASRMAQSNREIPHFHMSMTIDISAVNELRKVANKSKEQHLTLSDVFIYAVSRALLDNSKLNSTFIDEGYSTNDQINIGLAVDSPRGLMVPVIKNAAKMKISEISKARKSLIEKANAGNLTPDDLAEGTFTITNLGMYNIESFDPIIVPGQVGILGVGTIQDAGNGVEKINITLGCDHRVIDGVTGAKFLSSVKTLLEESKDIF